MFRLPVLSIFALVLHAGFAPSLAQAYDSSYYRTDFWGGEYPRGFTMSADKTIAIRSQPDPDSAPTIDCVLEKGATYHPWNEKRTKTSKLEFVTFVRTIDFEIKAPVSILVTDEETRKEETIAFRAGDRWTYLTYYAEGAFRMRFKGVVYSAEQDLFDASWELVDGSRRRDTRETRFEADEWLRLVCANQARGWIFMREIADKPGFEGANVIKYGEAADRTE